MLERSNIEFPLWRKKVDSSLLLKGTTPIPNWLHGIWNIEKNFSLARSITTHESQVSVKFKTKEYGGNVVKVKMPGGYRYRLFLNSNLIELLSRCFLMSYARALEAELTKKKTHREIEKEIPFWEFIDIEFDSTKKIFLLTDHYIHKPHFPKLYSELIGSPLIRGVLDKIKGEDKARILKQGWKPRSKYENELSAENVIYTLLDTKNKLIYIGEATKMISRFKQGHPEISKWDYYKYNVLPPELTEHRVTIERMSIRDQASLSKNIRGIKSFEISDYKLVNRKIDK
jgi:hypothetical protein